MNLYLRFFDNETFVYDVDEALDFLRSIPEINVTRQLEDDLRAYVADGANYPKRYKVFPRVYFIVIKTNAASMEEFKSNRKRQDSRSADSANKAGYQRSVYSPNHLSQEKPGWYEASLSYKQVVPIADTGKFEYRNTTFAARCKALSPADCYDRMVEYLKSRVDGRSQFPSMRGKNYNCRFLGKWK